ncbi:MAG: ribbon-helix-helix domain-containing protein, partial [Cyanobacteriota bacterium]
MATRQTSSSGRPKSPRIQVVLPEDLCERLAALAEEESRTVSNMAKVLIQQGVEGRLRPPSNAPPPPPRDPAQPPRQPEPHTPPV